MQLRPLLWDQMKKTCIHLLKVEVLSNLLGETLCGHTEPTIWNKFLT